MTLQCASCPPEFITLLESLTSTAQSNPSSSAGRQKFLAGGGAEAASSKEVQFSRSYLPGLSSTAEISQPGTFLLKTSSQEAVKVINAATKPQMFRTDWYFFSGDFFKSVSWYCRKKTTKEDSTQLMSLKIPTVSAKYRFVHSGLAGF